MMSQNFFALALLPLLLTLGNCLAADPKLDATAHIRHFDVLYKELIGKRITVDAVVWYDSKRGAAIMTPSGQGIYLRDAYVPKNGVATQRLPQGRLVRVSGILLFEPYSRFGSPVKPTEGLRSDLTLSIDSFEVIERANRPWPVLYSEQSPKRAHNSEQDPDAKRD